MYRENTKVIRIGDKVIGGGNPVLIQSMCNTKTEDVEATVDQILKLEAAGCDIIRVAVPTMEAADAIRRIKREIHIPLVADIHFDYRLAIAAMESGADKIRINPGNIGARERVKAVVDKAKEYNIPSGWESTADPWRRSWWNGTGESRRRPWWRAQKGRSRSSRSWATIIWW